MVGMIVLVALGRARPLDKEDGMIVHSSLCCRTVCLQLTFGHIDRSSNWVLGCH